MSGVSTHVLDTSRGRPAAGIAVALEVKEDGGWRKLASAETDADGRVPRLLPEGARLAAGTFRLTFETGAYFERRGVSAFYPEAAVVFAVEDPAQHYHVPLLLAPYGYSTYRGS